MILLRILIIVGGLTLLGTMIYDRYTGRRATRKILWPLLGAGAAIIAAIMAHAYFA